VSYRDIPHWPTLETCKRAHLISTIQGLFLACEKMEAEKSAAEAREQATYLATVKQRREIETMQATWTKPGPGRKQPTVDYETTTVIRKARVALIKKIAKYKRKIKK